MVGNEGSREKRNKKSIIDEDEIFKSLLKLYLLMYSYFKINTNQLKNKVNRLLI